MEFDKEQKKMLFGMAIIGIFILLGFYFVWSYEEEEFRILTTQEEVFL
jgi:hypothetical protein